MQVTVVGDGAVGHRVTRQLRNCPDLAVRSCGSAAGETDPPVEDCDVVVLTAPSRTQPTLARRYVDAGVDVVATADGLAPTRSLLALDAAATERGGVVAVGAGFSPGLTDVLVALAALDLDVVDQIEVAKFGTGGPACAVEHHRALRSTGVELHDRAWVPRAGGTNRQLVWFPEPVGGADCYQASMADPILLSAAFPSASRITARMAATRRDRMTARMPMLRRPHPEGRQGAVRVEVRGRSGAECRNEVYGAAEWPAIAAAAVAASAVLLLCEGGARRCGAAGLGELFEPRSFLRTLDARKLRASHFVGAG